jgi:lipopolysaccharide export system protein LptA
MSRIVRLCLICFPLAAFFVLISAPSARAQEDKVIVLHYADSLQGREIKGEAARELIGHVHISQGNVQIHCDRALQFVERGEVTLTGNVLVTDENTTLHAPRGMYHRDDRRAEVFDKVVLDDGKVRLTSTYGEYLVEPRMGFFRGNVKIVDSASTVTSDSLTYFRNSRQSIAEGRVRIVNEADHVTITGGKLEHDANTQFSRMLFNPVLIQKDSTSSGSADTLVVRSLVMESYRDSSKRFVAIDSVKIVRADLAGLAGLAVFFTQGDSILLRRSPVVWYQETQISGDSINTYLIKRKLRRVDVMGNAGAISRGDSLFPNRLDQVVGETMRLTFGDTALSRIDVDIHAISVYHVYEDTLGNGLNKISGDRIVMHFAGGKVSTIRIIGGVEGQYVPENLARDREQQYALPGLTWRKDRPRLHRGVVQGMVTAE